MLLWYKGQKKQTYGFYINIITVDTQDALNKMLIVIRIILCINYFESGRLPIEVVMNEIPMLMTNFESVSDHINQELPLPIPPKTVKQDEF